MLKTYTFIDISQRRRPSQITSGSSTGDARSSLLSCRLILWRLNLTASGRQQRADLADRCFIIRINDSFKKRRGFIELIRSCGSGHTMVAYTKRRFQRRVFINGLNTNVMKPVLKEIVFIGKAIASIKSKIINHDPERIIDKTDASFVGDTVIFAINVKLMEMVVPQPCTIWKMK